jgi:hypothetical protein
MIMVQQWRAIQGYMVKHVWQGNKSAKAGLKAGLKLGTGLMLVICIPLPPTGLRPRPRAPSGHRLISVFRIISIIRVRFVRVL